MTEELLCCYSPQLQEHFSRAKDLRSRYQVAGELRCKLKAIAYRATDFEAEHLDAKVSKSWPEGLQVVQEGAIIT
jgi:hypothetical protein